MLTAAALVALMTSLIRRDETAGGELLLQGCTVWATNVAAAGLWCCVLDRGAPDRSRPDTRFSIGEVTGSDPTSHGSETDEVRLVSREDRGNF